MIPLVLELDEQLGEGEEMMGIKTIQVEYEGGHSKLGYVAIIKNGYNLRYGSLKAIPYIKRKFNSVI
jgi:hypothetical protein